MTANDIVQLAIETYVRELPEEDFARLLAVARPTGAAALHHAAATTMNRASRDCEPHEDSSETGWRA
ncbi:hypothetical protein ACAG26_06895 [Mycobacterium sp. pUA109]|uniref:hypothetical protein n=1 Tax=Mycobacterium sp. pUA109 TaxID=3238982 RepID=UPI00351B0427